MNPNKDAPPNLDVKIVSDIVEAVMTSVGSGSRASLKDYIAQVENDDHDLSAYDVAELFDRVHAPRGSDQFYDLTVNEQNAEIEMARAAFDLGQDDAEELRIALEEAQEKVKELEESVTRPLEIPKSEKKHLDLLQSEAWKAAVEWINQQGSEAIDLGEMEAANPYEPDIFPPTEHGTVIASAYGHMAVIAGDGLEFLTLTYMESSDSWVGVEVNDEDIRYVDTEDIKPGTWKVVK